MNKLLSLLLCCVFYSTLNAQTMSFCTRITKEDQCAEKPKKFYIEYGKGARIYAVINLLEEVKTVKVYYKIYYLDKYNEEVYMNTISQDVLPQWKSFWKQFVFTQQMNYKIYLYDDKDKLLTSNAIFVEADYEY